MPRHVQKCQPCCPSDFCSAPKNVVCQCDGASKSRIFSPLGSFLGGQWCINNCVAQNVKSFSWGHSCSPNKISEGLWRWEVLARQVVRNRGIERSPWQIGVSTAEHLEIVEVNWGSKLPRWELQRTWVGQLAVSSRDVKSTSWRLGRVTQIGMLVYGCLWCNSM